MGLIVRRGETDFEPTPLGLQDAVCVTYFDIGLQRWDDKVQPKVVFLFELAARRSDGKPFTLTKEFTASLADNANLRAFLENWRGRAFSAAELEGFDLDKCVGVSCLLNLVQKRSQRNRDYVEIAAVMQARVRMTPVTPRDHVPEFVQRKIDAQVFPELEAHRARQGAAAPRAEGGYSPAPARPAAPGPQARPQAPAAPADEFSDDIPF